MFITKLFNTNAMTKTDSKIIKANDFMATRTGVPLKTIYDMRCSTTIQMGRTSH